MKNPNQIAKLRWQCRRGMLELDLLLLPFLEKVYEQLSTEEQDLFAKLLTCQDQDLYTWLIQQTPADKEYIHLIERVRNCA